MINTMTITFHSPLNYGAFLQAYALHKVLINEIGVANVILDYSSNNQKQLYSILRPADSFRNICHNLVASTRFCQLKIREKRFINSRKECLQLTKECHSEEELSFFRDGVCDLFICGSDQIWNSELEDFSENYYLPGFFPKIAYACSLGKNVSKESLRIAEKYLPEFSEVSVREAEIKEIISQKTGIPIGLVSDPTVLLSSKAWKEFIGSSANLHLKKSYLFLYSVRYNDSLVQAACSLSKKTGLRMVTAFGMMNPSIGIRLELKGIKVDYSAGPAEFLNYINNASLVLTDSFHGVVFSTLLHKQFLRYQYCDSNGARIRDERLDCFLEQVGLEKRSVIFVGGQVSEFPQITNSEWYLVDRKLQEERTKSLNWLKEAINSAIEKGRKNEENLPILYKEKEECCGCSACMNICPAHAIQMYPDEEGFLYPRINALKCLRCGKCMRVCGFKQQKRSGYGILS